jgi:hypothetical protein
MQKNHIVAIISGLAVGAFIGYEFAAQLNGIPPYQWIANYYISKAGVSA